VDKNLLVPSFSRMYRKKVAVSNSGNFERKSDMSLAACSSNHSGR
jgi:hypothetical protein